MKPVESSWERVGGVLMVRTVGALLVGEEDPEWLIVGLESNTDCDVILTITEVGQVSSMGMGVLVRALQTVRKRGRRLLLASDQPVLLEYLRLLRLHQVLPVYPDEAAALEALAGPGSTPQAEQPGRAGG